MKKLIAAFLSIILLSSIISCDEKIANNDVNAQVSDTQQTTDSSTVDTDVESTVSITDKTETEADASEPQSCTHTLGEWDVLTPASERKNGEETRKCTNCNYFETRILHAIGTDGLLFTLSEDETSYSVSAGTAIEGDVFIPEYHNGLPVTSIGTIGFFDANFEPENIERGSYAFYQCNELTSVVIPSTVTEIGDAAFAGCIGLKTIILPPAVAEIGNGAFMQCEGLESIVLSDTLTAIGDMAFMLCKSLKSVVIPAGIERIGEYAFALTETETQLAYYHSDIKISIPDTQVILLLREFTTFFSWGVEIYYFDENGNEVLIENITLENGSQSPFLNGDFEIVNNNDITFTVRAGNSENIGKWIDQTFDIPQCVSVFVPKTEDTITVFYGGNSSEKWDKIEMANGNMRFTKDNKTVKRSIICYYSDSQPTDNGNYWHYVDGVPTMW